MTDIDKWRFSGKSYQRWIPIVFTAVIMGVLSLVINSCSNPSKKPAEHGPFGHWSQIDKKFYSGRIIELHNATQTSQQTESAPVLPEDAFFDDYVRYALRHNPALESAFYRWRAALERVPQAKSFPDPQASFGIVIDQVDKSSEYMGERYSISQMFPWFGKLKLRGEMAVEDALAEERRFEAIRLQLIDQVGQAYFEYAYLHKAIAIARKNLELLIRLESVSRALFRAGTVSLSDVNRAQVEIGRVEDQVRSLEDVFGVAVAELNAALGRPAHAYLPSVSDRPSAQAIIDLAGYSDEKWLSLAKENNPELAAIRYDAKRQHHAIELARKDYYPDITLGVEYARDGSARMAGMDGGGADIVALMASFNLPVRLGKYGAGVREMAARFGETARQVQSREDNLEAEIKRALFDYRDSRRKVELYGGTLLPKAKESLAITEAAYRAGDTGFSDLVDAQRVLLEFSLVYERSFADSAKAFTRVQALIGRDPDFAGE
ncbi:MAG: TolC family protein [Desulfobacterales bacterium]